MFKSNTSSKIIFENSSLILFFPSRTNCTSFALSLLRTNYDFQNIGYLYSEHLASSVNYSVDEKNLEFNGSLYYNGTKNLFILDLNGGIKSRSLNDFVEELIAFIRKEKFSKVYIIGSSSKDNVYDEDLISKIINIYYLSNDSEFKMNYNIKNIREAFRLQEEERKGKNYYEMSLLESCDSLKRFVDRLVDRGDSDSFVLHTEYAMACTIKSLIEGTEESITPVLQAIELPLMFQRMYYHYSELIENQIVINGFSRNKGICVKVSSFPVYEYIEKMLSAAPYSYRINAGVLNAVNFGAPQKRERYIIVGVRKGNTPKLPVGETVEPYRTVREAIEDLQEVKPFYDVDSPSIPLGPYRAKNGSLISQLRDSKEINNHIITKTGETAKKRFAALEQGQNFHDLKEELKSTYTNYERTQNTIYLRLKYDEPCGTVVNVRKSMWVHPELDRALSIREAARLQTFPDSFIFEGTKDSQYQQVGNAVPPILAKAIALSVIAILEKQRGYPQL